MSLPALDGGEAADPLDPWDARLARSAHGLLRAFNTAGVLTAADLHVATRLAALGEETSETVILAAALAVRAPRLGHVHVDLDRIRATAAVEREGEADGVLEALPWPDPVTWRGQVAASPLVALDTPGGGADERPLRLAGSRLYLERLWADERDVAAELVARGTAADPEVDAATLTDGLTRLFATVDAGQRLAATTAVQRRLSVIAGGPGTGKTTTVARVLALLLEQAEARGERAPLIALAAPTGKAAARLTEAVHDEAHELAVAPAVRAGLLRLEAVTLHRLLGRRRDSDSRFRHDAHHALPYDVVVVDETSMVPLSLMARVLEAVRRRARLVLVGDPGQLASIEAGAVLGDIVGPAAASAMPLSPIAGAVVVLDRVHRFGGAIATLAEAVRAGDPDAAVAALERGADEVQWIAVDPGADGATAALEPIRRAATAAARATIAAARGGDAPGALDALGAFRLLCAHRRGPHGVSGWSAQVLAWLAAEIEDFDPEPRWWVGRPLLVTANDYELGLFNGDTGVVVARADGGTSAAFERRGQVVEHPPARLGAIDTVHAMTIHKSQGSQFATAAVILPAPESRLLTRELLYTALTRAERRLIVAGSPESVRAAVTRPIARASGLAGRLWAAG